MKYGNNNIGTAHNGSNEIGKAYYGNNLVWNKDKEFIFDDFDYYDYIAVDLGLPSGTLWSSTNFGASKGSYGNPETYYPGSSLFWGMDTRPKKFHKEKYDEDLCKMKFNFDGKGGYSGNPNYDLIRKEVGGGLWKTPTREQFQELFDNTIQTLHEVGVTEGESEILDSMNKDLKKNDQDPITKIFYVRFTSKNPKCLNKYIELPCCGYISGEESQGTSVSNWIWALTAAALIAVAVFMPGLGGVTLPLLIASMSEELATAICIVAGALSYLGGAIALHDWSSTSWLDAFRYWTATAKQDKSDVTDQEFYSEAYSATILDRREAVPGNGFIPVYYADMGIGTNKRWDSLQVRPVMSKKEFIDLLNQNRGESTPIVITFTIAGIQYQAEEGMTWEEWVNSDYNIDGYRVDKSLIKYPGSIARITGVTSTDMISASDYQLSW